MDKIIQHIGKSFSEMGATLTFFAIIFIIFMFTLYLFKEPLGELIKKIKFTKKVESKNVKCLWSHDLFITIDQIKKRVNSTRYTTHGEYDPAKSKLLKILVNNQLTVFKDTMSNFIKIENVDSFGGQKLKFLIDEALQKSTISHNKLTKIEFSEMGVSDSDSNFLIGEYDFFRDEVNLGFVERIESITTNENYHCNFDRMSAVFEVLAMGLYLIPKDSITACSKINGRFKKYEGRI